METITILTNIHAATAIVDIVIIGYFAKMAFAIKQFTSTNFYKNSYMAFAILMFVALRLLGIFSPDYLIVSLLILGITEPLYLLYLLIIYTKYIDEIKENSKKNKENCPEIK